MKMSKRTWLVIVTVLIALSAVGGLIVLAANAGDAAVYFPLKPGNTWNYKLTIGGEQNIFLQKVKVSNPENGNPKVIVYNNDTPYYYVYYLENERGLYKTRAMSPAGIDEYKPNWLVLSYNMKVGSIWKWESEDHKMKESTKVIAIEKVTVSAGTFDTVLIQSEGVNGAGDSYSVKSWYAKNIGLVKDETTIKGTLQKSELVSYQVN